MTTRSKHILKFPGLLWLVLVSGCSSFDSPATPEFVGPAQSNALQFAPLDTVIAWHHASCNHSAIDFNARFERQAELQNFFEEYCNSRKLIKRQLLLEQITKLPNWPQSYQYYFQLMAQQLDAAVKQSAQINLLKEQINTLSANAAANKQALQALKQQLAQIEQARLKDSTQPQLPPAGGTQ
ncbi:hypothetical protein ACFOEE_03600 [Pseudoalteromonas fenneropenaei]|uniref:Two-component system QseEF-associated lipoprotein QseG n=1 Tax=Pseudoalteromonas fenneropenaei TaxID=1737459 RepID=A0ABV7CG74_9GAMM